MAKKAKKQGFSVEGFDTRHYRQTEEYVHAIDRLYDTAIHSFSRLAGSVKVDPDKPFDFASRPAFQRRAQEIVNELANSMSAVIQHGTEEQWLYACKKNDAFLAHIMDTSKIGKRQLNKMQDKNLDALAAFQERKVGGLDLSQRVWQYAGQTKGLMELGIDIAVGDGRSAEELSRDLREYLHEPDKLFRRVRDKHGNLVLSKRAAAYHPGQGVYRSSYKNAIRLARTEINMAYRDSDRYRWNNMDFIVGFRVHLSNNHTLNGEPFHDICDELAGDYPKDFVFKGWHPNCRCFVTPILQDPDEFNTDELNEMKAAFFGTEYKKFQSRNTPAGVPKGFKQWVKKHKEESLNWRKQPYWIRDNFKGGTLEGRLMLRKPVIPKPKAAEKKWSDLSREDQNRITRMWDQIFDDLYDLMMERSGMYHIDCSLLNRYKDNMKDEYWNVDAAKAEKDRLIGEFNNVESRMKTDGRKLQGELIQVMKDGASWSDKLPEEDYLNEYCNGYYSERWAEYPIMFDNLTRAIDKGRVDIQNEKDRYKSVLYDCGVTIRKAKAKNVDTSVLESLVKTPPSPTKIAPVLIREMRMEINRIEDEMMKAGTGSNAAGEIPTELTVGSEYLRGEEYEFDKSFFALIDPKRPIKLEITKRNDGSYSSYQGTLVHIASENRANKSPWEKKSVIYHEYGHCIDAQRDLWKDPKLISMRESQIKRLKKKTKFTKWTREYNWETNQYENKRVTAKSYVDYIDSRLVELTNKIFSMKDETFTKRGITKMDVIEQIGTTRDTIKSLVVKYGSGHSTSYFSRPRFKETEYLAHAFENAFIGNRVFQKMLPDIYEEMIQYIKTLKPY